MKKRLTRAQKRERTYEGLISAAERLFVERGFHASTVDEIALESSRGKATYTEVEESEADLDRFERWLTSIAARDYFGASCRARAEAAVQRCRDLLADFQLAALAADTKSLTVESEPDTGCAW